MIIDEDWAIISSSSDYEDESPASSVIEPDMKSSNFNVPSEFDEILSLNYPGVTTTRYPISMIKGGSAEDSVSTIRPLNSDFCDNSQFSGTPSILAKSNLSATLKTFDARIRNWSKHSFGSILGTYGKKMDSVKARNIQSVSLMEHMAISLYSTLECHQELMFYYLAPALLAIVIGLKYGSIVMMALKCFTERLVPFLWVKPPVVPQTRFEAFKTSAIAKDSCWLGAEIFKKLATFARTFGETTRGMMSDLGAAFTNIFAKRNTSLDPQSESLSGCFFAHAQSLGAHFNEFLAFLGRIDLSFSKAHGVLNGNTHGPQRWGRWGSYILNEIRHTPQNIWEPSWHRPDANWKLWTNRIANWFSFQIKELASCVKSMSGRIRDFNSNWVAPSDECENRTFYSVFGSRVLLSNIFSRFQEGGIVFEQLKYSFVENFRQLRQLVNGKDILVREQFCSRFSRTTHQLSKSKATLDALSRKTYSFLWADDHLIKLIRLQENPI